VNFAANAELQTNKSLNQLPGFHAPDAEGMFLKAASIAQIAAGPFHKQFHLCKRSR
jgi:hypothetical protein